MKYIWLSFLSIMAFNSYSQEKFDEMSWNKKIYDKESTFNEIKEKFYSDWEGEDYVKGKGWKQFKRWESFWESRLMPDGSFPDFSEAFEEYRSFIVQNSSNAATESNWTALGPFDHTTTGSWSSGTGRVNVAVQDPNDANTIYVGTPAGGIWKSTNAGSNWTPLSDFLSVIGVSGIAVDPSNSQNIYITTGDSDGGNTYSIGVWKSTDGGNTWAQSGNSFGQGNKILIDPNNTASIWVAASTGLFKSTDSGQNWTNVQAGNIRDIALKPNDPQTIYAVTSDQCYVSTNGGALFSVSTGLPGGTNRLAVTVSPANQNYVYLLAADGSWGFGGVYRSVDSGMSFATQNNTTNIFNGSNQAWYDMALTCSDTNPNILIAGVLNLWRSADGGVTWGEINSWSNPSGASYTHADIHYLNYFDGNLYCGSDGGVYKSTNNGNSFTDLSDGLQIGQYYTIAGTQNDPNTLCGGLQDNGGYAYTNGTWKCYYGADGMGSAVDPNNANEIWGMIQNGSLYYTTNGGFNLNGVGSPESGRWVTPMLHDPNVNRIVAGYNDIHEYVIGSGWNQISTYNFPGLLSHIEIYEGNSQIMYASSSSDLARTDNGGTTFTDISLPFNGSISSIEINPTDDQELWVTQSGWSGGAKVYHSTNAGSTWNNLSLNLPNLPTNIIKYNSTFNGLYVGMDIGIYYYNDIINSWIPFNENLPNVIVNDLEINEASNIIRAGTYGRGIWESPVYDSSQSDYDLLVLSLDDPSGTYCNANSTASAIIRNIGLISITSFDVEYSVGGNLLGTYSWTGTLDPANNVTITLPNITNTDGNHTYSITLQNPNGVADENPDNNTAESNYTTILDGELISFNLLTDCYPGETSWALYDGLNNTLNEATQGSLIGETDYANEFCLANGCYTVTLSDSYGDGLSSASCADGTYSISDESGTVLVPNGVANFGNSVDLDFCIGTLLNGCIDQNACNYNSSATVNDGTCDYSCTGCMDELACNYDITATIDNGTCNYDCYGCTDSGACNYDTTATIDNGLCDYSCQGCTDATACNYDASATISNNTCTYPVFWYYDSDGDGFGDDNSSVLSCTQPLNYIAVGGDCEPTSPISYPGADEICDGVDNNCDGFIDEGFSPQTYYRDADGDGYGVALSIIACEPDGYFRALFTGDCVDNNITIYPGAPGTHEDIDNNCNNVLDYDEKILPDCYGDLNGDQIVSILDLAAILSDFGCLSNCNSDLNFDGAVTSLDISIFLNLFGTSCD